MMMKTRKRQRRGALAVEFSLTLIVLFTFILGAIELGLANMMYHTAESAAYEGARVAMLPGATAGEAEAMARQVLATARVNTADVQIEPADLDQDTETVRVTISFNFSDNITLMPRYMDQGPVVRSCELSRELVN